MIWPEAALSMQILSPDERVAAIRSRFQNTDNQVEQLYSFFTYFGLFLVACGLVTLVYLRATRIRLTRQQVQRIRLAGLQSDEIALFKAIAAHASQSRLPQLSSNRGSFEESAARWVRRQSPLRLRKQAVLSAIALRQRLPLEDEGGEGEPPGTPKPGTALVVRAVDGEGRSHDHPSYVLGQQEAGLQIGIKGSSAFPWTPGQTLILLLPRRDRTYESRVRLRGRRRHSHTELLVDCPGSWRPARLCIELRGAQEDVVVHLSERSPEGFDSDEPPRTRGRVLEECAEGIVLETLEERLRPGESVRVVGARRNGIFRNFVELRGTGRQGQYFLFRPPERPPQERAGAKEEDEIEEKEMAELTAS